MKRFALIVAGTLAAAAILAPASAFARHGGGGHGGGGHGGGGHGAIHFARGGGGGRPHFGPRFAFGPHFARPRFARPHFGGPRFFAPRVYGWHGPRRVFIGGYGRPYPVFGAPPFGYGFGPGGCSTRRSVSFLPGGWRKIVTVRTCYVR